MKLDNRIIKRLSKKIKGTSFLLIGNPASDKRNGSCKMKLRGKRRKRRYTIQYYIIKKVNVCTLCAFYRETTMKEQNYCTLMQRRRSE